MRIYIDNREFSFLHYKRMLHVNLNNIIFFFDPVLAEDSISNSFKEQLGTALLSYAFHLTKLDQAEKLRVLF
jgi:hypothetical protein